jgi:diguanylate cyclase
MFKKDPNKAELQWKSKYFDSLEEIEKKEKQWGLLENTMRKSMSRLSVLLNGLDKKLDKDLDYLRLSIRKGADGNKIAAQLEAMFETLEKVEAQQSKKKRLNTSESYQLLLERLKLPKGTARKVKSLKKNISHLKEGESPADIIGEFDELIRYSLNLLKEEMKETTKKQLIEQAQALQASFDSRIVAEQKPAASVSPSRSVSPAKVASSPEKEDLSGRMVLMDLISHLDISESFSDDISAVQQRLKTAQMEQELNRLASQLAAIINDALPDQGSQVVDMELLNSHLTINEVLLQLLEKIELPAELSHEVLQIQHQLEGQIADEDWPVLLDEISQLIHALRSKANEEKKSLESFLTQLTEQLQTLDNFISGVEQDHQESVEQSQTLNERMEEHIHHIGMSVESAMELDQLKQAVRTRLETVVQHMNEFRDFEESRDKRAQQKIEELNEKIKLMEGDSQKLREQVVEERESALTDQLTEVKNRMAYDERIEQEYAYWKRYQTPLSQMVIDIDFFKKINDNYGHIAGDKVLHTVAQHLQNNIRETDFLARYGGEEFVIIMPGTTSEEAMGVAEKLRHEIETCGFHYRGEAVMVTISCGVAQFAENNVPRDVFIKADEAMYKAKSAGRNRCCKAD